MIDYSTISLEKDNLSFSVPGNVLLLGEYHILERGGLGLCCATNKRGYLHFKKLENSKQASYFLFSWEEQEVEGSCQMYLDDASPFPALGRMLEYWKDCFPAYRLAKEHSTGWCVHVDTRSFSLHGKKLGLGSSAVAVCLLFLALKLLEGNTLDLRPQNVLDWAPMVRSSHNAWQNKQGSGYDVYTSLMGGIGIFEQQYFPKWMPLNSFFSDTRTPFSFLYSSSTVKTTKAVVNFHEWQKVKPQKANELLKYYQNIMQEWLQDKDINRFMRVFQSSTFLKKHIALSEEIGAEIKKEAIVPLELKQKYLDVNSSMLLKNSGAGNELFWMYGELVKADLCFEPIQDGLRVEC